MEAAERVQVAHADLHDRKARKVRSVMGCELRRQLSEPGAGDCCDSMGNQIE